LVASGSLTLDGVLEVQLISASSRPSAMPSAS